MKTKSLYQVLASGTRALVGSFGTKHHAVNAMRNINSKRKPGEPAVFVSPGPDHWRSKEGRTIPARPSDSRWEKDTNGAPIIVEDGVENWLEWYTSRREEAFA